MYTPFRFMHYAASLCYIFLSIVCFFYFQSVYCVDFVGALRLELAVEVGNNSMLLYRKGEKQSILFCVFVHLLLFLGSLGRLITCGCLRT